MGVNENREKQGSYQKTVRKPMDRGGFSVSVLSDEGEVEIQVGRDHNAQQPDRKGWVALRQAGSQNQRGDTSCLPGALLATPRTTDGNGAGHHGDSGMDLRTQVSLLPTPAVNDMGAGKTPEAWDAWTEKMQAEHGNGNGHGKSLAIESLRLSGETTGPPSDDGSD